MTARKPRIAITMGDPAGVGPELCLHVLASVAIANTCTAVVLGDRGILSQVARRCGLPGIDAVPTIDHRATLGKIAQPTLVDFSQLELQSLLPGRVSKLAGRASYEYLEAAIASALVGDVDAIVTAPINKEALHASGIRHPGHTEILADLTQTPRVCMMLTSADITCSLVTAHVGLQDVPQLITTARILETIELTVEAMRRMRGGEPRLTVCGLNPHAGEHGLFGKREEETVIAPAIEEARGRGVQIIGPLPPDTAFLPQRRAMTDAYICMYHDQGLIPLKMLAFETAINITLGLPIIRTSVDHGTAFDIAWQGIANPRSMLEAIRLAVQLSLGNK